MLLKYKERGENILLEKENKKEWRILNFKMKN